jgi:hypothetical protein
LLAFAKETIGSGVRISKHMGVVKDLQLAIILRKGALQRQEAVQLPLMQRLRGLDTGALAEVAGSARGPQLKLILTELEKRKEPEALDVLAKAAASKDEGLKALGYRLLGRHMKRQPAEAIKESLKDKRAVVRLAAAGVAGSKGKDLAGDLIGLLDDADACVRETAHKALVGLAGRDFGPPANAGPSQRVLAIEQWRQWFAEREKMTR